MFRGIHFIILLILIASFSCRAQKESDWIEGVVGPHIVEDCRFVKALLETKPLSYYVDQFNLLQYIRIIDQTKYLEKGYCTFKTHGVYITDHIIYDYNTGKYIDIVIFEIEKIEKDKYEFKLFYAPHDQTGDCRYRLKMRGVGFVNIMDDSVSIENFKVNIFD